MSKLKAWKTLESEELAKYGYFRLRKDKCELANGKIMPGYYTIEFSDWVNIIPITKDKKIVLINQYRHSIGEMTVEIPGGSTNPKLNESMESGAVREMEEETGYTSSRVEYVGFHHPNPALISNKMHTFIAWDCEKTKPQELDQFEEIDTFEATIEELKKLISTGKITHSIILGSLLLSKDKLGI